ncbi:hypothetical protein [Rhodopseudomonas sp. BR0G17]|uniref:hypothetical protein n=1 Tax=Rhodopseudomonas sp. BR0G17 TaxID=2269368 RepID=UPI0013DF51AF|nr:hypothetical protein [Rhodopseudomonas sp. BR0G17]NEW97153.1 hypothetical protein [Rhodopseudomonas sp. BR0G17]
MVRSRPHARVSAESLFVSAKTRTAIPARHDLVREALVQATLDPLVRAIEFVPASRVREAPVTLDAIVLVRDDGRHVLDVVPARPVRDVEEEGLALLALDQLGLPLLTISEDDIRRQPRFANSRLVWDYRHHPVGIEMRMQVLTVLRDDGPMALGCLLRRVRGQRDPSPAVLALACADMLELDLITEPLGPTTMVRGRS